MHVDLDLPPACGHALKHHLPELVTPFRDTALTVDTKSDTADLRHGLKQCSHGVATVRAVIFGSEPVDCVVRAWTRIPAIAVHPDSKLEIQAACCGLLADKTQHFQIAVAFDVRQLRAAHAVT